ncbi:MAG: peroxiredoxin [Candidatus Anstonellales archaeon]
MIYDIVLKNENSEEFNLSDLKGKWVVIYFYPKDDTPGCTLEAKEFSSKYSDFKKENCEVIGVSKDTCESHLKFKMKYNLGIILLSDRDGILHNRLKVNSRSTFIFNPEGELVREWRGVNPSGHAEQVLMELRRLKNKV